MGGLKKKKMTFRELHRRKEKNALKKEKQISRISTKPKSQKEITLYNPKNRENPFAGISALMGIVGILQGRIPIHVSNQMEVRVRMQREREELENNHPERLAIQGVSKKECEIVDEEIEREVSEKKRREECRIF
jgi:hypothetical protein